MEKLHREEFESLTERQEQSRVENEKSREASLNEFLKKEEALLERQAREKGALSGNETPDELFKFKQRQLRERISQYMSAANFYLMRGDLAVNFSKKHRRQKQDFTNAAHDEALRDGENREIS